MPGRFEKRRCRLNCKNLKLPVKKSPKLLLPSPALFESLPGVIFKNGSSPNYLIEYFRKAWQGLGTKGRLSRETRDGILPPIFPSLSFRKPQRGREKKGSEDKGTPPPRLRRNPRLMIASKMTFVPSPRNRCIFYIYQLFDRQLIWR